MKKLAKIFGALIVVFILAAAAVPFFVDVDQYRPKIVEAAQEHINGKLEIGKLKLSMWGTLKVQVDGLKLTDVKNVEVVSVKDAYVHFPWWSLFTGSPELILKLSSPNLNIIKMKDATVKEGKLNVMMLVKSTGASAGASAPGAAAGAGTADAKAQVVLPAIVLNSRLGLELSDANLMYQDQVAGTQSAIKDLNVKIRNISLSRPMDLSVVAKLDSKLGQGMQVVGPIEFKATVKPELNGSAIKQVDASFEGKFSDLEIIVPGSFHKKSGIEATVKGQVIQGMEVGSEKIDIKNLNIVFHTAQIGVSGIVSPKETAVKVASNEITLEGWKALIPALAQGDLKGVISFNAQTRGPNDKLDYEAELKVKDLMTKTPSLKAEPKFNLTAVVKTDTLESFAFQMTAPGNDLQIRGKVKSFTAPQFDFQVTSKGMDLDQLMDFSAKATASNEAMEGSQGSAGRDVASKPAAGAHADKTAHAGKAPQSDLDQSLDPIRVNPMMARAAGTVEFQIPMLKAKGIQMDHMNGRLVLKDLVASLSGFGFKVFGGQISASSTIAMKPTHPTYKFAAAVSSLSMQKAIDSQMAMFKNTVSGTANFKIDGSGVSFNPEPATRALNAKGDFKITDSKFTSLDISKMVSEGLEESIGKITAKLPGGLGNKLSAGMLKKLPAGGSEFEVIASDFGIKDGVFSMPNFVAKSKPGKAVDLKGSTTVNMINQGLQAHWEVIDTHNITGAKDISVDLAGTKIESILAEKGQPVKFPITVSGTTSAPITSKTETIEYLLKIALKNSAGAASGRLKQEATKILGKSLGGIFGGGSTSGSGASGSGAGGAAPSAPSVQKAAEGLKKLFGR